MQITNKLWLVTETYESYGNGIKDEYFVYLTDNCAFMITDVVEDSQNYKSWYEGIRTFLLTGKDCESNDYSYKEMPLQLLFTHNFSVVRDWAKFYLKKEKSELRQ